MMTNELFTSSNKGADIIIRTSDNQDLFTHKFLLARASAFFQDMFNIPQPKSEKEEIQFVTVTESSAGWRPLLTWIDPSYSLDLFCLSLDHVSLLISAVDKYLMDGARTAVCALLRSKSRDFDDGLRLWALALIMKDQALAKDLARSAIIVSGRDRRRFSELDSIPASNLLELELYGYKCSDKAIECLKLKLANGKVFQAANASRLLTSGSGYSGSPGCIHVLAVNDHNKNYGKWLDDYIGIIERKLKIRPCRETLQNVPSECFDILRPAYGCTDCGPGLDKNIADFHAHIGRIVEEEVSEVEVPDFI